MSDRFTLGQFKTQFNWVQFLNLAPSDPRWLLLFNEAVKRLMDAGLWCGTYQRYQICTTAACLTWPRQFDTIEVVDICGSPVTVRNQWFEFLDQGPGLWRGGRGACGGVCCPTINYIDRGRGYVMFDDVTAPSKIRFYTQFAADAGKVINIRGYESGSNQWVLTDGGATEGENVTLTSTFVDTVTTWMPQVFRDIIKDKTLGHVRAYAVPVDDPTALKALAVWEPSETIPNYRRCVIPALSRSTGCCNGLVPSTCKPTVTVMAKLAFIPLESDLDIVPLTCAPAIKMAMLSILKQERGDSEGARDAMHGSFNPITRQFEDGAIPLLEAELAAYQGSGSVAPLRLQRNLDTANIVNLI